MNPHRARHLRKAYDRSFDLAAPGRHEIRKLVNNNEKIRHEFLPVFPLLPENLVIIGTNVAGFRYGENFETPLHFRYDPPQDIDRSGNVGNDGSKKMG